MKRRGKEKNIIEYCWVYFLPKNHRIAAMITNAPPMNQLEKIKPAIPKISNQTPLYGIFKPFITSTEKNTNSPTTISMTALIQPNAKNESPYPPNLPRATPKKPRRLKIPSIKMNKPPIKAKI